MFEHSYFNSCSCSPVLNCAATLGRGMMAAVIDKSRREIEDCDGGLEVLEVRRTITPCSTAFENDFALRSIARSYPAQARTAQSVTKRRRWRAGQPGN